MSDEEEGHLSGLSSLVRLSGVNVPARAQFLGETLVSATISSLTVGLTAGLSGAVFFPATVGPLVPALVGLGVGYNFGLYSMWASSKRRMMWFAQQYPTVLAHALRTENQIIVPASIVRASQERIHTLEAAIEEEDSNVQEVHQSGGYNSHLIVTNHDGPLTLDQWIVKGGLARVTWAVVAAQSCQGDVRAIQNQQRQKIVDNFDSDSNNNDDDK